MFYSKYYDIYLKSLLDIIILWFRLDSIELFGEYFIKLTFQFVIFIYHKLTIYLSAKLAIQILKRLLWTDSLYNFCYMSFGLILCSHSPKAVYFKPF